MAYSKPSSYSKPPASSNYSKPAAPAPNQSPYSKPSVTNNTSSKPTTLNNTSVFNRQAAMASPATKSALISNNNSYKQPPIPISRNVYSSPGYTRVTTTYHDANGYLTARSHDIVVIQNRYPTPYYVYNMHPNYGFWDAYFMSLLITRALDPGYAEWAYSHYNDPSYIQWHQDMMIQAQNDANLQQQIATLDAKVAALRAQNAPTLPDDALPPDVTPAIAVAPTAVAQDTESSSGISWIFVLILVGIVSISTYWFVFRKKLRSKYTW